MKDAALEIKKPERAATDLSLLIVSPGLLSRRVTVGIAAKQFASLGPVIEPHIAS